MADVARPVGVKGAGDRRHAPAAFLAPLPLGLVAAGLCQPGDGHPGHLRAGAADHGVHPDCGLCGVARLGSPAPLSADASALRADDPRLAGAWRGVATGQVGGDVGDAGLRADPAGGDADCRLASAVDGAAADRLHGGGRDLVVAAAGTAALTPSRFTNGWLYCRP